MHFEAWGQTDVGLKREVNQDSILVDHQLGLYIVADGMGGHRGGEVASAMAVETSREVFQNLIENGAWTNPKNMIDEAYREASARIYRRSSVEEPELQGMGTTMVLAFFTDKVLYIGNVGDSRAYMVKDQKMWQLTEDHSLVHEQLKAGVVSEEEIHTLAGRNVITRSVGFEKDVKVDIVERAVGPGEKFIFCSDGLSGLVQDPDILTLINKGPIETVVPKCIEAAKSAGGDDNISMILLEARE